MHKIKIALVDDHSLVRNAIAGLIKEYENYEVVLQASNGKEFIELLPFHSQPEIVLLDINMPVMDGYLACAWLRDNFPDVKVLALSMYDKEHAIIRMLRNGARGYLLKDIDPKEFRSALDTLVKTGYYYSGMITGRLIHAINKMDDPRATLQAVSNLTDAEIKFLQLVCTELTYKEIAAELKISTRMVDSMREQLFEKLGVHSRIGLALYAIRNGIISVD